MAIKAIIDKLEDVDEKYRDLYTERSGKFEMTGVEGYKTQGDIDRINSALTKERSDHKALKDKFSALADVDVAEVVAKLAKYPELEELAEGKLDEKKIDKIVEARLNAATAPLKRELETKAKLLDETSVKVRDFESKEKNRTISDAIRASALKLKVQDVAIDDAIIIGSPLFDIDEAGTIISKDGLTPEIWLGDQKERRTYWWGPSQGGGSRGANGSGGGGTPNPFTRDGWNITEQGRLVTTDPQKAEQLAHLAGTTVGGGMPPAKRA